MVKRFFSFLNRESNGINEAALLLGGFAFLSQLLGLIRDRMLAHFVGAGPMLDTYYAAFRIPDFLYKEAQIEERFGNFYLVKIESDYAPRKGLEKVKIEHFMVKRALEEECLPLPKKKEIFGSDKYGEAFRVKKELK